MLSQTAREAASSTGETSTSSSAATRRSACLIANCQLRGFVGWAVKSGMPPGTRCRCGRPPSRRGGTIEASTPSSIAPLQHVEEHAARRVENEEDHLPDAVLLHDAVGSQLAPRTGRPSSFATAAVSLSRNPTGRRPSSGCSRSRFAVGRPTWRRRRRASGARTRRGGGPGAHPTRGRRGPQAGRRWRRPRCGAVCPATQGSSCARTRIERMIIAASAVAVTAVRRSSRTRGKTHDRYMPRIAMKTNASEPGTRAARAQASKGRRPGGAEVRDEDRGKSMSIDSQAGTGPALNPPRACDGAPGGAPGQEACEPPRGSLRTARGLPVRPWPALLA